jgi:hypothetical protein
MKDSPAGIRAHSVLGSPTSVTGFVYVASSAIAVPRPSDYLVLLFI